MAFISNLTNKIGEVKQGFANKKDFKQRLIEVCSDGKITDAELEVINRLAEEYNIEEEDFKKVNAAAYEAAFKAIISDGVITEQEEKDIIETQQTLMVLDQQIPKHLATLRKHRELRNIQRGILPVVNSYGLILKGNEQVHFRANASLLEERVISRKYQGGSSGVNIRVAKGVSFKVGQQKGRSVSEKGIVTVDEGDFYVTSQRLIFKGSKKNFSLTFAQLVGYEVFKSGIDISANKGNTKMLKITDNFDPDMLELMINIVITR
ncbi:MAG: hypothetical protein Q4P13_05030 [Psychrobacter sp.]|nr:hypothetical protein [Psychrobacter sp.]